MERELPKWVSSDRKYDRAVLELKKSNLPVTDEAVKALYVKYGGLVITEEVASEIETIKENAGFFVKKSKRNK